VDRLCRHDRVVDDLLAGHRCRTLLLAVAAVVSIRGAFGADPTTPCWPTARAKRRTSPRLNDLVDATAPRSWPVRNSTMSTGFDRRATGSTMTTRLSSENCSPRIGRFQTCRPASGVLCGVRNMRVDSVGRSHPADPGGRARGITRDRAPTSHPTVQGAGRRSGRRAWLRWRGVTEEFCDDMYDARSDWVHGNKVELFAGGSHGGEGGPVNDAQREAMAAVALLQDVLRTAARRAVEDPAFRETFRVDDAIRARWPI
jgi:hypothetical protein